MSSIARHVRREQGFFAACSSPRDAQNARAIVRNDGFVSTSAQWETLDEGSLRH